MGLAAWLGAMRCTRSKSQLEVTGMLGSGLLFLGSLVQLVNPTVQLINPTV